MKVARLPLRFEATEILWRGTVNIRRDLAFWAVLYQMLEITSEYSKEWCGEDTAPYLPKWKLLFALVFLLSLLFSIGESSVQSAQDSTTTLGLACERFTINGQATFLLGFSYFAALGAPEDFVRKDLDDFQQRGFNWLRIFATWNSFGTNISAVDSGGHARKPFIDKLTAIVDECDRRELIVDITLARGKGLLPDFNSHKVAVKTLVATLRLHRNWYLDLANEHDVRDERYVSAEELKILRAEVRKLDPNRLVTASFGGHDVGREEIREAMQTGLDFLCPHRPRDAKSAGQTLSKTRDCLALLKEASAVRPVLYQEPFRRGYTDWEPKAGDFSLDLTGAIQGGAAGWCFHNGSTRRGREERPRRSFDLRVRRLFDQLDSEERKFVDDPIRTGSYPDRAPIQREVNSEH